MNGPRKLEAWEVLAVAIRSEEDSAAFYSGLRGKVRNVILHDKLDFLVREEGRHKKILQNLFSQRYPDKSRMVPAGAELPKTEAYLPEGAGVPDLFKAALKAEERSEAFYLEMSGAAGERLGTSWRIWPGSRGATRPCSRPRWSSSTCSPIITTPTISTSARTCSISDPDPGAGER